MAEFVLVHGGMHGSWCWSGLEPELQGRGHRVVTPEYQCDGVALGGADFASAVSTQMAAACVSRSAIVVAHSMSGLFLPLIPDTCSVGAIVFLCALIPEVGKSFIEQVVGEDAWTSARMMAAGSVARLEADEQGLLSYSDANARAIFYSDVPASTTTAAVRRLRAQTPNALMEPTPLLAWPAVPTASISALADPAVPYQYSRDMASRLGIPLTTIPGGHSPFYSQIDALAEALEAIAEQLSSSTR